MCCINIHLTVNSFTFNTDCICNKTLNNGVVFFWYKFYEFVEDFVHTQNPSKVYNVNYVD